MATGADRSRQGIALLGAAAVLGVAGDTLMRTVPARLDAALGVGAFLLVLVALAHARRVALSPGLAPLGLPLALFGVALIWRDSPTIFALDLLGLLSVAALAAPRLRTISLRATGLGDLVLGTGELVVGGATGAAPLVLSDIDWRKLPAEGKARRARETAVGLVAAAPVAALFGGLLMHADPVFARLLAPVVAVDLASLAGHAAAMVLWAWLAAGVLRIITNSDAAVAPTPRAGGRLGLGEIGPVLAVVDLLFLVFVAVQFRYLFGGTEQVRGLTGLGYAEYARRGFFELVAVAALSLPLLLVADWSLDQRDQARVRWFRALAGLMLLLLNVMLASALLRMRLYTAEYGLTELRLYTTAFMGWLVLVFGWCGATVLRGRRKRFGSGALAAGWLVLAVLNLVNPDGLIATVNLDRAAGGRSLDAAYAAGLSADALPRFRQRLEALPPEVVCPTARALAARWRAELEHPSRWTIALAEARRARMRPIIPSGCGSLPVG